MKEKSQVKIFISYRRKGGIDTARWLHDQLRDRDYNVFLDMEGLRSGAFNTALYHQIKSSDVFLMVLSKDSLKRCRSKNDWVRQELAYAFRCGLNVIPIMKEDFEFPKRLPQDISPIRSCQGLRISYQFFDAFLEKLEEYILTEPESIPTYIPEPEPPIQWPKYAAMGVAAAALLTGVFLLGRGCTNTPDPNPSGSNVSTQSTAAPENTAPPAAEGQQNAAVQELGNSTGNQCNGGTAAVNQFAAYSKCRYLNTLGNWRYHVGSKSLEVYGRIDNNTSQPLMKQQGLSYLLVTTDWIYYTVDNNGSGTLYRAARPEGAYAITNSTALVSGFSTENELMIDGEFAYYWRTAKGLYKLDLATGQESLLLDQDATRSVDMIGKSGSWVYLYTEDTISRVHIADSRYETVFRLDEHFSDASIAAGNVSGTTIYFAVTDQGRDAYHHYDRAYRMHTDGSELERIFVADTSICRIKRICVTDTNIHLDMECGDDGYCHIYINLSTGKIGDSEVVHTELQEETACISVGNTVTNLCNVAVIAPRNSSNTSYMVSPDVTWYNLFSDAETSYFYDIVSRKISVSWKGNDGSSRINLLEDVNCHYLHVTTDWLYCVLEKDDVSTLYRAQNNMEDHSIGELEAIITDVYAEPNRLTIRGDKVYYWRKDKGLFTARTDGTGEELLYDNGGDGRCTGWITFHVNDEYLYFWAAGGGIYGVNLETGKASHVLNIKEQEGTLAHAVAVNGKFAYVLRYITDGAVTSPDELWVMNEDGTNAKKLVTGTDIMHIQSLNASGNMVYLKTLEEGATVLYKISSDGGELIHVRNLD